MNKILLLLFFSGVMVVVGLNASFNEFRLVRSFQVSVVADDQALVKLIPVKPYADIKNGKLVIKFGSTNLKSGVGPDSKYVFDKVFCITSKKKGVVILSIFGDIKDFVRIYSPESLSSKSPEDASTKIIIPLNDGKACIGFVITTNSAKIGEYAGRITVGFLAEGD